MSPPALHLSDDVRTDIVNAAIEAFPNECCGVLIGHDSASARRVVEAVRVKNIAPRQVDRFELDPLELLRLEQASEAEHRAIVGFFHSHPNGSSAPSEIDRAAGWPFYSYLIAGVDESRAVELRSWRLREDESGFDEEQIHQ